LEQFAAVRFHAEAATAAFCCGTAVSAVRSQARHFCHTQSRHAIALPGAAFALAVAHRSGEHQPVFADYHMVVLARTDTPTPLTTELMPPHLPDGMKPMHLELGEEIELVGMTVKTASEADAAGFAVVRVTLVWTCRSTPADDFRFGLTLDEGLARWGPFHFARGACPTSVWTPGRLYQDDLKISVAAEDVARICNLKPVLLH
jgi:hypothetical protein